MITTFFLHILIDRSYILKLRGDILWKIINVFWKWISLNY